MLNICPDKGIELLNLSADTCHWYQIQALQLDFLCIAGILLILLLSSDTLEMIQWRKISFVESESNVHFWSMWQSISGNYNFFFICTS